MANKKTDLDVQTPRVDLGLDSILPLLEKREKARDEVIGASRPLVRHCALAIKQLHAGEVENAKKEIATLEQKLKSLPNSDPSFEYLFEPIWQEMVEAKLLMAAVERKALPTYTSLGVPPAVFLLGVCDAVGEFRRAMLESLRMGKKTDAQYYFALMDQCYDQLSIIRFSGSLLPNFKPKQDMARHSLEQARSEILRA
jgi:translin